MVDIKNKITNQLLQKWEKLLSDPELIQNRKLTDFDLRLASMCFEIATVRNMKLDYLDSNFLIMIYEFFLTKGRNYYVLVERINYLNNLKIALDGEVDLMFEMENLLTCFLEQLEICWSRQPSMANDLDIHTFAYHQLLMEGRYHIHRFVKAFNEMDLVFN